MSENNNGHKSCRSHCCGRHGCQYGYDDCPVITQEVEQAYPCQDCPTIMKIQNELNHWQNELTWWKILQERELKKEKNV